MEGTAETLSANGQASENFTFCWPKKNLCKTIVNNEEGSWLMENGMLLGRRGLVARKRTAGGGRREEGGSVRGVVGKKGAAQVSALFHFCDFDPPPLPSSPLQKVRAA